MGYYGKVFTRVWRDEKFRALTEEGRELFLYLLTSPHLNIIGFYYLPPAYAADDLQWPVEKVYRCMDSISPLAKFDRQTSVVLIPKYLKWNSFDNVNQAKGGAANLEDLPRTALITYFKQAVRRFAGGFEAAFAGVWEEFGNPSETPSEPLGDPIETQSNSTATTTAIATEDPMSAPPEPTDGPRPPNRKDNRAFANDSFEIALARRLRGRILENLPNGRVPPDTQAGLGAWCRDLDLMIRVDNRSPADIEALIDWCQADPFWRSNILSAGKLRSKYDQLMLRKREQDRRKAGAPSGVEDPEPQLRRLSPEEIARAECLRAEIQAMTASFAESKAVK